MKLTYQEVQAVIGGWSIRYREAGYDPDQLEFLVEEYFEDLSDEQVTSGQFQAAIKIARRRCKFFPKVADILEAKEEYCKNPERFGGKNTMLQIAATSSQHDPTPEEQDVSRKIREIAGKLVRGKITLEEHNSLYEELMAVKKRFYGRLRVVGE